ncbi:MAG: DNA alkylation repair protein [Actinobacteria bacterium]|nr:DNA alkylation repair protein [Actinomycetota bacterium]MBU4358513.1 DNA alkylation repair protein [Actinomycetota bacterium]
MILYESQRKERTWCLLTERESDIEPDVRDIEKELGGLIDQEYREGLTRTVPTSWTIRGVRVPELKRIAKEHSKGKKTEEGYSAVIRFVDDAFRHEDRELALVGLNMLMPFKKFFDSGLATKSREWIANVHDWEICDNLAYVIMSELLMKGLFTEEDLLYLRDHENLFARRAYIVCGVIPLRNGWGDTDKNLSDISYFAQDRDHYMVKALSWALRSAVKSSPQEVSEFLDEYRDTLHPSIVREVTNKLEKGTKR